MDDRYASLALIETIRLYLSFLSGNSVSLFCLRFTLRNRLFRNSLKFVKLLQGLHVESCGFIMKEIKDP